ncbi:GNAT family N-acetyltransferase [Staphylococcus edaphicus]|uniref:GNAT family N-acetyltransferase n=1 Tax=Staphylococcus edaphicus TaxID=1955013 RepID=A0A2C6VJG3_9STAP|nr:GNAT family N-acetyltransferase [Staphylococcus edaphicus]PHK50351.1 GNAT family N-acetyltransferase [Staphylococcus edaphicus]UQW82752.1 GNAT family N-acetyltransferase [Staphylococcus edaphicus]
MIEIKHAAPHVSEYRNLRKVAGLSEKSQKAAEKGIANACFDVTIYHEENLIGMGRVIGDGGTAFQIIDIAVDPKFQGQGYGKTIMSHIMSFIEAEAEVGTYVSLIADYPADQLYAQYGFVTTEPQSCGMYMKY